MPYAVDAGGTLSSGYDIIRSYGDSFTLSDTDAFGTPTYIDRLDPIPDYPYVTFAVVPIPATLWLFGSGLLGFVRVAIRKVHL